MSASRMVTRFIDGLTTEMPPPSLGATIKTLLNNQNSLIGKALLNIAVFGSVARGDAKLGSDIDLMVKVPDDTNAFRLTGIQSDLQEILVVRVEIVTLK